MTGVEIFFTVIILALLDSFCWYWVLNAIFETKITKTLAILFSIGYTIFTVYIITCIN